MKNNNYSRDKGIIMHLFRFSGMPILFRKLKNAFSKLEIDNIKNHDGIHPSVIFRGSNIVITHPNNVKIGEGSVFHSDTFLETSGGFSMGRFVHCGRGLTVFTTNHNFRSEISIPYDKQIIEKPVKIEDFVWIGANVSIVPGVKLGEGSIIGMGTVLTKDVPDYAIMGGNPGLIIGYRDNDVFEILKRDEKFF